MRDEDLTGADGGGAVTAVLDDADTAGFVSVSFASSTLPAANSSSAAILSLVSFMTSSSAVMFLLSEYITIYLQ